MITKLWRKVKCWFYLHEIIPLREDEDIYGCRWCDYEEFPWREG